jgi:hypothetical protein
MAKKFVAKSVTTVQHSYDFTQILLHFAELLRIFFDSPNSVQSVSRWQ